MDNETMLEMLKVDLQITTTAYDERLGQYLETARAAIETEGINLTESVSDGSMVVMYAAWLWRKRDEAGPMPRMLRRMMNNRLFSQKMTEE